jgi:hypothetical protein
MRQDGAVPLPITTAFPGTIAVESDGGLATAVNNRPVSAGIAALPHKTSTAILAAATGPLVTTGAHILLEAATAANPFGHQNPMDPMSWWSQLRYYWAFGTVGPATNLRLRLSDDTDRVRYHHRTALSEHIALGVGIQVARRWLSITHPGQTVRVVDAEAALADPNLITGLTGNSKLRPDFVIDVAGGPLIVLECKGSESRRTRYDTMARALRQLASISHNGNAPSGLVVHVTANRSMIAASVVDPDGDEEWETPPRPDENARIDQSSVEVRVGDVAAFRSDVSALADASLLAWGGAEAAALRQLPDRLRVLARRREVRDNDTAALTFRERTYVGIRSRFDIGNETFVLFRGVDARLHQLLKQPQRTVAWQLDRRAIEREIAEAARVIPDATDNEVWASTPNGAVSHLQLG